MTGSELVVVAHAADSTEAIRDAAWIWAHAAARRDQSFEPPDVHAAVLGICHRLDLPGARLLLARQADEDAVGFAVFAPGGRRLEVFYLAVHPRRWGLGVAARLLLSIDDEARRMGCDANDLWVIDDNTRATWVYEREGWTATGELQTQQGGRLEQRFIKHLD